MIWCTINNYNYSLILVIVVVVIVIVVIVVVYYCLLYRFNDDTAQISSVSSYSHELSKFKPTSFPTSASFPPSRLKDSPTADHREDGLESSRPRTDSGSPGKTGSTCTCTCTGMAGN